MYQTKWWDYVIIWGVIGVLVVAFIFWMIVLGFHLSANTCHGWGIQNHRPVRYVQFNWFTRECITKVSNGQWLPTGQVRGVLGGN